jgi:pimeloyl-ACP methyl ester carboxylesterase
MKYFAIFLLLGIVTNGYAQVPERVEFVPINGKTIYYESWGSGEPLILLHGYSCSSKYWLPYIFDFCDDFKVYLVDLTGHGKSDEFKENLSIKSVAEDLNELIKYLKINQIKAIGYSYGGDVLYQLAALNQNLVKTMITIGSVGSLDIRKHPEMAKELSIENIDNLEYMKAYQKDNKQIRLILEQFQNYIVKISDEELKSIKAKTLIVLGDDDTSRSLEEVSRIRKLIPNTDLWILPNTGHGAHEDKNYLEFLRVAKEFLKE